MPETYGSALNVQTCIMKEVSMGTIAVGLAVLGIVSLIVRSMVKDKKQGKSIQCGNDCKHCGGHCSR